MKWRIKNASHRNSYKNAKNLQRLAFSNGMALNLFYQLYNLNAAYITFGFFREDYHLPNHIVIFFKQVIFRCRNLNLKLPRSLVKAKIKITYRLELSIAKQNKTFEIHNNKWKEQLPVVSELV